jgi:hypothetical protein
MQQLEVDFIDYFNLHFIRYSSLFIDQLCFIDFMVVKLQVFDFRL